MLEGGTFQDFAKLNFWVCQKKGRNHDICLLCDKSAYCINKMCPLTEQCAPYHGSRGMKIPQPGGDLTLLLMHCICVCTNAVEALMLLILMMS